MVDVGAHFGIELAIFAGLGWQVYAFEPDPKNRRQLVTSFGNHPRVAIDARAVSDVVGQVLAFYTRAVSTGCSGLSGLPARLIVRATCRVIVLLYALFFGVAVILHKKKITQYITNST